MDVGLDIDDRYGETYDNTVETKSCALRLAEHLYGIQKSTTIANSPRGLFSL